MSKVSYPLKLTASVMSAAQRLAKQDGVSLNQWIASVVAEKIGAVQTADELLRHRAGGSEPEDLLSFLDAAPDEPPAQGDERD